MAIADPIAAIEKTFAIGIPQGVIHAVAEDDRLDGRIVHANGRRMVNFGSCSYLGLEMHPQLKAAVVDAVHRFGTQFSSTRTFLSSPDYPAAEEALSRIFRRPTVATTSSSMANLAALPTLIRPAEAMILDAQVHRSVQAAATLAQAAGAVAHVVPHSNLQALERRLHELAGTYERIWYVADGLYSMWGDNLPAAGLDRLVAKFPQLWLYVDDAHSISWTGEHGRGHALEQLSAQTLARTVVIGSLNKSFAAAGGVMTFPTEELRDRAFGSGWPMIFSGPLQPPMLAAVLASARLHLTEEVQVRQASLLARIRAFNQGAVERQLPLVNLAETPIRFIAAGNTDSVVNLGHRLQKAGFFANCCSYPAVPPHRAGLRIGLTLHQTEADIEALLDAIADNLPHVLAEAGITVPDLTRGFHRQLAGRKVTLREVGAW